MTATADATTTRHRIAPTVPVATGVFAVYVLIFNGLMVASGIKYDALVATTDNVVRGAVIPLVAGAIWLVAFLAFARWDHVFRDPRRLPMGFWFALAPALMLVATLLRFAGVDWGRFSASHLLAIVAAGVLVGFTEETLFRGIILRALRNGARREGAVILWSSLWFGFFHLTNLLTASPLTTVLNQCVQASLAGVILYLARRWFGVLIVGMALHGLWDMSSFAAGVHLVDGSLLPGGSLLVTNVAYIAAIVVLIVVWRRKEVVTS